MPSAAGFMQRGGPPYPDWPVYNEKMSAAAGLSQIYDAPWTELPQHTDRMASAAGLVQRGGPALPNWPTWNEKMDSAAGLA